jgi:competence protein ComEC
LVVASLAATTATAPLVAFHFQQVSLVGPAANLVAVPLTGFVVLPAAWLSLLAAALPQPAADLVVRCALLSADALIAVARWCAAPSWATVATARPPALLTLLLLALAGTLLPPASGRLRRASGAVLAAVAASAGWWAIATHGRGLSVVFLDVGQGLAVVARLPGGKTLLYDAGPRWRGFDAGERIVVPALRRLGVWRLDTFAISHGHPDHAGGSEAVRSAFPAAGSLDGASLAGPGFVRDLAGGVRLRLLNPGVSRTKAVDENDRSLAVLLGFGETGFVFTGDAGPSAAAGMIAAAGRPPSRIVLQAPHHGGSAEACRTLAEALRPEVSVISVGRNSYGHPRPGAEAALAQRGRVLRTDREGAVFIRSDGARLSVRTWRQLSTGRSWSERVRWLAAGW